MKSSLGKTEVGQTVLQGIRGGREGGREGGRGVLVPQQANGSMCLS